MELDFSVVDQDVDLDIDFSTCTLRGRAAIRIDPHSKDLKSISLRCRQLQIQSIRVDSFPITNYTYRDPYEHMNLRSGFSVNQHHLIDAGVERKPTKDEGELVIPLPVRLKLQSGPTISLSLKGDTQTVSTPVDDGAPRYREFTIHIEYTLQNARDSINWIGLSDDDQRLPQVYTYSNSLSQTLATYVFPCVDSPGTRHPWKFTITSPRTIADIASQEISDDEPLAKRRKVVDDDAIDSSAFLSSFSDIERSMELAVVCSGDMEDSDAPIEDLKSKRKWIFNCPVPVSARHVGFAIGPFEMVDLTKYRESDQDDKLGQSAYNVHGFCLPGREPELRNICIPVASAMDSMSTNTVFFPFETSYKICFVDDLPFNVVSTAAFSLCSSKLLVPEEVIDPRYESIREVIRAVCSQWIGVKITASQLFDSWIIVGGSYFMADKFLSTLYGKNEHRFRLKQTTDKICKLDVKKPSIYAIGAELDVDESEYDFLKLKAPMVLHILHNRIIKANGRNGVDKMFWRALLDDQTGKFEDGQIDTDRFMRIAEKVAHAKFDPFFNQWVFGAGCPSLRISQRFNKKKTVVEIFISQSLEEQVITSDLTAESFMSHVKEREENFLSMPSQRLFTGPMTIRIHEADGTPYEHIVDIKEMSTKVEIPYNTKYKRLKRNKKSKKKAAAVNADVNDDGEEALLYCLGDVLQGEDDIQEWDLHDWTREDESKMNDEHYEWIRLDKDFEWIAEITFNQPHYMWVSQLQQDNDVVAQVESIQYLNKQQPFPLISTILVRTLMDKRYYYGVRVMAAHALARCATPAINWIGLKHLEKAFHELYCFENSRMTRSNDFSDLRAYKVQCAIIEAMGQVRDSDGRVPDQVKQFLLDKIKFNDNTNNDYSDDFYISILLNCLARSLIVNSSSRNLALDFGSHDQEVKDAEFQKLAVEEIQRLRRIDQWIPSFHNLYTVAALDSQRLFMSNGLITKRWADFLKFTEPGNSDSVRIKAFDCLVDLDAFQDPAVMAYFVYSYSHEPSPCIRASLWNVLSRAFGCMALAVQMSESKPLFEPVDGLIIDETQAEDSAQAVIARTQTLSGAIANLVAQVGKSDTLQEAITTALTSPHLGAVEFLNILTLCRILYVPDDRFPLALKLPQYWKVKAVDGTRITFKQTGKYRTKPFTKLESRLPKTSTFIKNLKRAAEPQVAPDAKRPRPSPAPDVPFPAASPAIPTPSSSIIKIKTGNTTSSGPKIRIPSAHASSSISTPKHISSTTATPARASKTRSVSPRPSKSKVVTLKLRPELLATFGKLKLDKKEEASTPSVWEAPPVQSPMPELGSNGDHANGTQTQETIRSTPLDTAPMISPPPQPAPPTEEKKPKFKLKLNFKKT
jgi:transcription initiation factor TFIID subunit 2